MKCEVCNQGPMHNVTVFRNGPKGQIVPWRCWVHLDPQWKPGPDLKALTDIIEDNQP